MIIYYFLINLIENLIVLIRIIKVKANQNNYVINHIIMQYKMGNKINIFFVINKIQNIDISIIINKKLSQRITKSVFPNTNTHF